MQDELARRVDEFMGRPINSWGVHSATHGEQHQLMMLLLMSCSISTWDAAFSNSWGAASTHDAAAHELQHQLMGLLLRDAASTHGAAVKGCSISTWGAAS